MAKNRKKGKVEKEIFNFNNSVNAIFEQSKPLSSKRKKEVLKQTKKDKEKALKKYNKSQSFDDYLKFSILKTREEKLEKAGNKLPIKYGNFDFYVKPDYFQKLKDKERYMDNLYNRKMKSILSKYETPKNDREAKEMQSLMNLYAKKIQGRNFYDAGMVQNVLNKLKKYRDTLTLWELNEVSQSIDDTGEVPPNKIYDLVERPVLLDDELLSLEFNFF